MSGQESVFTTEIAQSRPNTTNRPFVPRQTDQNFYFTFKKTKEEMKRVQNEYQRQLASRHRVQRSLETTNHKSLIKRIQFLKVYGNKKAMFHNRQMLDSRKFERQKCERKSMDMVKRRKLQEQLQHILRQNEEEDQIFMMQKKNKNEKEQLQNELKLAQKRTIDSRHHDQIKRRNHEFMIRKKNLHTSVTMRSRNNYRDKVHQQLNLINHYETIINDCEQFFTGTLQTSKDNSTKCNTIDFNNTMFITSKNSIS